MDFSPWTSRTTKWTSILNPSSRCFNAQKPEDWASRCTPESPAWLSPPMPRVVYEKMPSDIADRYVLLLDPILATGVSSMAAIDRLQRRGVRQDRIMFVTVIAASQGIHQLAMRYPQMKIITSEVDAGLNENNRVVPGVGEFGDRYFGTEEMRARFDLDEDEEIGFE